MYYLLFLLFTMTASGTIAEKQYSLKNTNMVPFLYSALSVMAGTLCFVVISGFHLNFRLDVFLHSLGFSIAYSTALIATFFAIKTGPLSITTLVSNYSLMIPVLYGILILRETPSIICMAGILLLVLSLFLISDRSAKNIFSFKWLIFIGASFIGNGMCSTLQKHQQVTFDGAYKNEFMIMALMISFFIFLLMAIIRKEKIKTNITNVLPYSFAKGITNGIINYLVMVLSAVIPNSVLFPTVSAGGVIIGFVLSTVYYKERLTKIQLVGYFAGAVSVVLLNL